MPAVASLPKLAELDIRWNGCGAFLPVGLFSNLSKLSVSYGEYRLSSFISQMATVIGNSPRLRFLHVSHYSHEVPPTLGDLFAKVSTKNPLCLEHLSTVKIDVTVNQLTLPHLTHLTSFDFQVVEGVLAARVWTSFLAHNIKLSDVVIRDTVTKEAILYLSSFSGLKKLAVLCFVEESLKSTLLAEVLPKHVNSLRTLEIPGWVNHTIMFSLLLSP
jgi:hypothetical protein